MTDAQILDLINEMRPLTRYSRQQAFDWHTRHLSQDDKVIAKARLVELWQKPIDG